MAGTDIIARLKLNAENFSSELNRSLGNAEKRFGSTGGVIGRNLREGVGDGIRDAAGQVPVLGNALTQLSGTALVAAGGIGAVTAVLASGVGEAEGFMQAVRGVDAVLTATGNKTGFVRDELVAMAEDLEGKFALPAEEILNAEKALASFDGVAGATFRRSIELAGDMAAVFGGDITSNAEKLGTVLQNLAAGDVEGLGRGFKFLGTEALEAVSALAHLGDTAGAQELLLAKVRERVGGAGEANAQGLTGSLYRLGDAAGDAGRDFALQTRTYETSITVIDKLGESVGVVGQALADASVRGRSFALALTSFNGAAAISALTAPIPRRLTEDPSRDFNAMFPQLDELKGRQAAERAKKEGDARRAREAGEEAAKKRASDAASARRRAEAKAASDAAQKTRELDQSFVALEKRYDPLAAVARRYANELAEVNAQEKAGKLNAEAAATRKRQIGSAEFDEIQAFYDAQRKSVWSTLSDPMQRIGDAPIDIGPAANDAAALQLVDRSILGTAETAGERMGWSFRNSGLDAARDIADLIGGKTGSKLRSVLGGVNLVGRLTGGKGDSAFEKGMSKVTSGIGKELKGLTKGLGKQLEGIFGGSGGSIMSALGTGFAAASVGSQAAGIFSSITGMKSSTTGGLAGGLAGFALGGPLGAVIGGVVGSSVLGALKKTKWGATDFSVSDGMLAGGTVTGNSASAQKAAGGAGKSVIGGLNSILEGLGARLVSAPSITVGQRHGDYRVNTGGTSLKVKYGAKDFDDDQQAAVEYAIQQMLVGAVLDGISAPSKRILKSGQELEKAVEKAGLIESIPKSLKARLDPVAAAIDNLNSRWKKTVDALTEGGASAEQMAQAQRLYNLELDEVKSSTATAAASLKDFVADLKGGPDSPFSLRDQEAQAMAALQPFFDQIEAGKSIDQSKYQAAAQTYLDIERQLYGSTQAYFAEFDRVMAATSKAITSIENAEPISAAVANPFAEATAKAAQATAEMTEDANEMLRQAVGLLGQIAKSTAGGGSAFVGGLRSFAS